MKTKRSSPPDVQGNALFYGDNLDVLRRYIRDESVDLVYLDPPFNSNADYNVLFAEHSGERANAQIKAFGDTWRWDTEAAANFSDAIQNGGEHVAKCMSAFRTLLGQSDMLAYLSMMAPRLVELHRALKPTGSIHLHCDPTASHYLKLLMDSVFGPELFINDISWKRTHSHGDSRRKFSWVKDVLLVYGRSKAYRFNRVFSPYSEEYIAKHYRHADANGRRFQLVTLRSPHPRPNLTYDYRGFRPHANGWAVSRETMEKLDQEGRLQFPAKPTGAIREKYFLDEMPGVVCGDIWSDIPPISAQAKERLGYPTQKPEQLLERIISSATSEGDVVLDPFCGCGTTIAAAQKLGRRWIGIDITHLAVNLIKVRLRDAYGPAIEQAYKVIGEPVDLASAQDLANSDKYQFQFWALGLVGARPDQSQEKKGADKGIDGRLYITEYNSEVRPVVISVKGGHVSVAQVRDLRGVVERENAAVGVFICIEEPTAPMRREAADAGFYESKHVGGGKYPRLQILTIEDLLSGKRLQLPPQTEVRSFKMAPRAKVTTSTQAPLF